MTNRQGLKLGGTTVPDRLLADVLGRSESLFAPDLEHHRAQLKDAITGARFLVVGGGGSIGRAFVAQLAGFQPAALHVVDLNENSLVEVIRTLRGAGGPVPQDLRTFTVDFAGPEFRQMVRAFPGYDGVFNFSALKHVRAERDVFTLMRMVDVNVRALNDFLTIAQEAGHRRVFSVSTDKTVNPANLMGATKRLMEMTLFAHSDEIHTGSARFANVAFSDGSLLQGFLHRIAKGQPLAGPNDVKRYFISEQEAGELCLLSSVLGENRDVYFPKLAEKHLKTFEEIAEIVLRHYGCRMRPCAAVEEAIALRGRENTEGWPCIFGPSDTTGEKSVEEFFAAEDHVDLATYQAIGVVKEPPYSRSRIAEFLDVVDRIRGEEIWDRQALVRAIMEAVPTLQHCERHKTLDEKF